MKSKKPVKPSEPDAQWAQQSVQLPPEFRDRFRDLTQEYGLNSGKILGTIAYGFIVGMREELRWHLFTEAMAAIRGRNPADIRPEEIIELVVRGLAAEARASEGAAGEARGGRGGTSAHAG